MSKGIQKTVKRGFATLAILASTGFVSPSSSTAETGEDNDAQRVEQVVSALKNYDNKKTVKTPVEKHKVRKNGSGKAHRVRF